MAIAHLQSSPPSGGEGCSAPDSGPVVSRDRPERSLLELRRGGWMTGEQVAGIQYGFLLEAATDAAAELGYTRVTVDEIATRSGVSRKTFYEMFRSLDDCLLAAVHRAHGRTLEAAGSGARGDGSWEARVRGGIVEVLGLWDAQPAMAKLCAIQALAGPPATLEAHDVLVTRLAEQLTGTAQRMEVRRLVSDRVARGLVNGALLMVHHELRLDAPDRSPLVEMTGELAFLLCGPFVGAAAVSQLRLPPGAPLHDWSVSAIPVPPETTRKRADRAGEGTRKQILRFVIAHPGASNLMVGEHMGTNESTTSRRMAKLAEDGLVTSVKRDRRHAWRATPRGRDAVR